MQQHLTVITAVTSVLVLTWAFFVRVATGSTHLMARALMGIVKKTTSVAADIVQPSEDMQDEELGSLLALELDAD